MMLTSYFFTFCIRLACACGTKSDGFDFATLLFDFLCDVDLFLLANLKVGLRSRLTKKCWTSWGHSTLFWFI